MMQGAIVRYLVIAVGNSPFGHMIFIIIFFVNLVPVVMLGVS